MGKYDGEAPALRFSDFYTLPRWQGEEVNRRRASCAIEFADNGAIQNGEEDFKKAGCR